MLAGETGLEIGEFRRKIVQMVQKGEREARQAKEGDFNLAYVGSGVKSVVALMSAA